MGEFARGDGTPQKTAHAAPLEGCVAPPCSAKKLGARSRLHDAFWQKLWPPAESAQNPLRIALRAEEEGTTARALRFTDGNAPLFYHFPLCGVG